MTQSGDYVCTRCGEDSGAPMGSYESVANLMAKCAYCRQNYLRIQRGHGVLKMPTAEFPTATGKGMGG
jgi:DNA-directed RNA polymerase subunit RPC12/RpoP